MSDGKNKPTLRFGIIGSGYMGKAYAIALGSVGATFELSAQPVREMIATTAADGARRAASALGFARSTGDWRELVADPAVDVVGICSPTHLHKDMALAALAAGKHVLCEKPLALNGDDARAMAQAAERAGRKTLTGFNYMKSPATQLAREIVASGEIGEVVHFRGTHNEDYLLDPHLPIDWRLKAASAGPAGALLDIGSHIVNMAHYLVGPIEEVIGEAQIVIRTRPGAEGRPEPVENDDQATFLARFANGAFGAFEASRVSAGRKNGVTYDITGTRGAIRFDQERMGELKVYTGADPANRAGFRTILIGPSHPDYGQFCISPGHGFGYNDMIVIEMRDMIEAVAADRPLWPSFRDAAHTAAVIDAVQVSQADRRWTGVEAG